MFVLCLLLCFIWILYLLTESYRADQDRKKIQHVIHVNGTRGKTTTCRLIEAGLRGGGYRVFCKTTGTDPLVIDTNGNETPLRRHGKTNIKEQIALLGRAAREQSEILVIECMALSPEYQRVSQHRILKADIGVITNVRRDHTDVMGTTLSEICDTLCLTVPNNGLLFTGETALSDQIRSVCEKHHTQFHLCIPDGSEPGFDFAENIALALQVCEALGVDRQIALDSMISYKRDPYTLSVYRLKNAFFINALSANDIDSTLRIWKNMKESYCSPESRMILLLNNRSDRGSRTLDMIEMAGLLAPDEVWLTGSAKIFIKLLLQKKLPSCKIKCFSRPAASLFTEFRQETTILAAGNIAGQGRAILNLIQKEGQRLV